MKLTELQHPYLLSVVNLSAASRLLKAASQHSTIMCGLRLHPPSALFHFVATPVVVRSVDFHPEYLMETSDRSYKCIHSRSVSQHTLYWLLGESAALQQREPVHRPFVAWTAGACSFRFRLAGSIF